MFALVAAILFFVAAFLDATNSGHVMVVVLIALGFWALHFAFAVSWKGGRFTRA